MSRLLDFYRGEAGDTQGRRLAEILEWTDDQMEEVHDFIQWIFPLPEPSQFNAEAPLLTDDDVAAFRDDSLLKTNLLKSFHRFLAFLGLTATPDGRVMEGDNLATRESDVWCMPNHNWLRITRLLRSLTLLGSESQAKSLFGWLERAYLRRKYPITAEAFWHWTNAVKT